MRTTARNRRFREPKARARSFFTNCNLKCVYCQNYPISQMGNGVERTPGELACQMLWLQEQGCHNLNLVTPTHFMPQILKALAIARERGFNLPIVYNTSGYESVEALRLLDGIVDIYLPDMRYSDDARCDEIFHCAALSGDQPGGDQGNVPAGRQSGA